MKLLPTLFLLSLAASCASEPKGSVLVLSGDGGESSEYALAVESAGPPTPSPGPEHAVLQRLVGEWDAKIEMGDQVSTGEYEVESGPGGFSVYSHYVGIFDGAPFEGRGVDSWDPHKHKYVTMWVDSWTDHAFLLEGSWDEASQSLVLEGENYDSQAGQVVRQRHVTKFLGKDEMEFQLQMQGPDGAFAPMLKIHYTRD